MIEVENFIYRYRSLEKIFKFNELENLEIYFSKPSELNDQMENYMNIIWQGDEIAFKGLFKHYLYTLCQLYIIATLVKPGEKLDKYNLPIFIQYKDLSLPLMETTFKKIYEEFFSSNEIAEIPKLMADSQKKYSTDEILTILKTIHLYAYFVINTQIKREFFDKDLLNEDSYNKIFKEIQSWKGFKSILKLLNQNSNKQEVATQIYNLSLQQQTYQIHLKKVYKDKDTYNIDILSFEFPELYINQIKKLMYGNFCVACFSGTYKNEPMWSHYANCENGICLRFKIKNDQNKPYIKIYSPTGVYCDKNGLKIEKKWNYSILNKIDYNYEYPEIDFFKSLGCIPHPVIDSFWLCDNSKTKFSSCLDVYKDMDEWRTKYYKKAREYICTKSKNWEYEQEYRVFKMDMVHPTYEDKNNRLAKYNFEDLDAIIFGRKVSFDDKKKVIKIIQTHCKNNGQKAFKFYDLYYSTLTKQLEIKPCNDYILSFYK